MGARRVGFAVSQGAAPIENCEYLTSIFYMSASSKREAYLARLAKQAEIDAAWAEYSKLYYKPELNERRSWLQQHYEKQKRRCWYCQVIMHLGKKGAPKDRLATIDHVIARSVGGADVEANTVGACLACNTAKGSLSEDTFRRHPSFAARCMEVSRPPDRLCADASSPYHDEDILERGVGVRFNGGERTDVEEYCVSEGWVRVPAGKARDRFGKPVTLKLRGQVEPYFLS